MSDVERLELEAEFIQDFGVKRVRWSPFNLSRMLRRTGERRERIVQIRAILDELGTGGGGQSWLGIGGVFDHGKLWGRDGLPMILVGHPYQITRREQALLDELATFTTLRVAIDDRPSYYGFGTHHVRVELAEARRPFDSFPATYKTRAARLATRRAFREAFE